MARRLLTILIAALAVAGICAFFAARLFNSYMPAAKPVASTKIIAASGDIKLGTVLTASNLTTIEIIGSIPKGAILKPENAIGRGVAAEIYQGEPILDSRLASSGSGGGLAATIPTGMRACAVKVDDVVGVAGFATPGMRVDVLFSGVPPGIGSGAPVTAVSKTVLQYIQVLSAGTDYQKDAEGKARPVQVVTLMVTPEQAETLSLANNQVKIQLVLRNPLDTKINDVPVTGLNTLLGEAAPLASSTPAKPMKVARIVHVAAPETYTVDVINGTKSSKERFVSPEGKQ
jgi:pilus assembly protein CpaB